ncbi:MAG: ABC transporter ATP-binding protein [Candidatus Rokubacteria bacterium]|nr:ABC transporter ATP-binding protein [Candidatus Rokubacteria bacterium]
MARTVVALEGVRKAYGAVRALDGIDLAIFEGELLSLLGPSGCGKTTTLNVIAGFVEPEAGRVTIDGTDVTRTPPYRRGLGVVFQSYALFPHMSVAENVAFGLRERGLSRREAAARVGEALELVRLPGAGGTRPGHLSGGMQQRVALARALVIRPRVLLLDEPLAALDKKLREEMRAELREIQRTVGITTVFVTHDQHEALGLSDRIAVMNAGRIEQLGGPREIYERPATRFVADFIGASSVLAVRVVGPRTVEIAGGVRLDVDLGHPLEPGTTRDLLVRPERVELGGAGQNTVSATVASVMYLGDHTEVRMTLPGDVRLLAVVRGAITLQSGDAVTVTIAPDAFLSPGDTAAAGVGNRSERETEGRPGFPGASPSDRGKGDRRGPLS